MKRWFLFFGAGMLVWFWARPAPSAHWNGSVVPEAPHQSTDSLPSAWDRDGFKFAPLARFDLRAVVLSRCNYRGGYDGDLAPTDFALGWGCMSDAAVVNQVKVKQDMRWFFIEWRGEPPAAPGDMMLASANMHLIPANDTVRRELAGVGRHEILELSGYLVDVSRSDGWRWTSSTRRDDQGGGACEVVWVERVRTTAPAGN